MHYFNMNDYDSLYDAKKDYLKYKKKLYEFNKNWIKKELKKPDFYTLHLLEAGFLFAIIAIPSTLICKIPIINNKANQLLINPEICIDISSFLFSSLYFAKKTITDIKLNITKIKNTNILLNKIELEKMKLDNEEEITNQENNIKKDEFEKQEEFNNSTIKDLTIEEKFNIYFEKVENECLDLWFVLNKNRIETKTKEGMKTSEDHAINLFEREFWPIPDVVEDRKLLRNYSKKMVKQIVKKK